MRATAPRTLARQPNSNATMAHASTKAGFVTAIGTVAKAKTKVVAPQPAIQTNSRTVMEAARHPLSIKMESVMRR